jgi:hypothetical protein
MGISRPHVVRSFETKRYANYNENLIGLGAIEPDLRDTAGSSRSQHPDGNVTDLCRTTLAKGV